MREVLVGDLAVLQIGQLGRGQGELLGQRDRLAADFVATLPERHFDRHAGFDADQQQVERVGKGALDRELALGDRVLEEQHRAPEAEIGRADADADLDRHRLLHMRDQEEVDDRADEQHERRHDADEQEGDVGRLAAIAGHDELVARGFLREPFGEVEVVDDLWRRPASASGAARPSRSCVEALALALRGSARARSPPPSCAWRGRRRRTAASPAYTTVALAAMAASSIVMKRTSMQFRRRGIRRIRHLRSRS